MENLVSAREFWRGKKVLVTGHSGFKGSWLSVFLRYLEADVYGLSLDDRENKFTMFSKTVMSRSNNSFYGDIRDFNTVSEVMLKVCPDVVIHMAAKSLVKESYSNPLETLSTNVQGTANIIWSAARQMLGPVTVVIVTSDKCYRNNNSGKPFVESDALGGRDPYSASKACAEIVSESMRASYCFADGSDCSLVTTRCGNVIGGGDLSMDRIIPDAIRAFSKQMPLTLRMPEATRPWIHVLDALWGYILLAQRCAEDNGQLDGAWNFSPSGNEVSVGKLAEMVRGAWREGEILFESPNEMLKEAECLRLDSSKARKLLNWSPILDIETAVSWTVEWYKREIAGEECEKLICEQIERYFEFRAEYNV